MIIRDRKLNVRDDVFVNYHHGDNGCDPEENWTHFICSETY